MDITRELVNHVLRQNYEDLPTNVIEVTKRSILDTLGSLVAGSFTPESKIILDLVREWGGKEEASIFLHGGKVPVPNATYANTIMARALELDDHHKRGGHLSVVTIPAFFAIAEYLNRPVSGKEFILGSALAADINCRIRLGFKNPALGWMAGFFAPFGIVAVGGKWLGFDADQTASAMGVAYSMIAGGNNHSASMGVSSAWTGSVFGSPVGVTALVLASRGVTGSKNPLQGPSSLYSLYARDQYDPEVVVGDLGKRYEGTNVGVKLYASCFATHHAIQGVIEIVQEQGLLPADINEINVATNTYSYNNVAAEPVKYAPQTVPQAKFSIPYTVATAVKRKQVFLSEFTEEAMHDPEVLALCRRVHVRIDPKKDELKQTIVPVEVEIRTKSGRRFSKHIEYVKGEPENPLTYDEVADKFRDCAAFSGALSKDRVEEIIGWVRRFDEIKDVREIAALFAPEPKPKQ